MVSNSEKLMKTIILERFRTELLKARWYENVPFVKERIIKRPFLKQKLYLVHGYDK